MEPEMNQGMEAGQDEEQQAQMLHRELRVHSFQNSLHQYSSHAYFANDSRAGAAEGVYEHDDESDIIEHEHANELGMQHSQDYDSEESESGEEEQTGPSFAFHSGSAGPGRRGDHNGNPIEIDSSEEETDSAEMAGNNQIEGFYSTAHAANSKASTNESSPTSHHSQASTSSAENEDHEEVCAEETHSKCESLSSRVSSPAQQAHSETRIKKLFLAPEQAQTSFLSSPEPSENNRSPEYISFLPQDAVATARPSSYMCQTPDPLSPLESDSLEEPASAVSAMLGSLAKNESDVDSAMCGDGVKADATSSKDDDSCDNQEEVSNDTAQSSENELDESQKQGSEDLNIEPSESHTDPKINHQEGEPEGDVNETTTNSSILSEQHQDSQDEIEKNANSMNNESHEKNKEHSETIAERRSKRQRTSAFARRFTPGEGGGLAYKKYKINDFIINNSGRNVVSNHNVFEDNSIAFAQPMPRSPQQHDLRAPTSDANDVKSKNISVGDGSSEEAASSKPIRGGIAEATLKEPTIVTSTTGTTVKIKIKGMGLFGTEWNGKTGSGGANKRKSGKGAAKGTPTRKNTLAIAKEKKKKTKGSTGCEPISADPGSKEIWGPAAEHMPFPEFKTTGATSLTKAGSINSSNKTTNIEGGTNNNSPTGGNRQDDSKNSPRPNTATSAYSKKGAAKKDNGKLPNKNDSKKASIQNDIKKASNQNQNKKISGYNDDAKEVSNKNDSKKRSNQSEAKNVASQHESKKGPNQNNFKKGSNQTESKKGSNKNDSKKGPADPSQSDSKRKSAQKLKSSKETNQSSRTNHGHIQSNHSIPKKKISTDSIVNSRSEMGNRQLVLGPSYRWIDDGVVIDPSKTELAASSDSSTHIKDSTNASLTASNPNHIVVEHQGLEIDFRGVCADRAIVKSGKESVAAKGKSSAKRKIISVQSESGHDKKGYNGDDWIPPRPLVVRPGDSVLLCSGDIPWQDLNHLLDRAHKMMESIMVPGASISIENYGEKPSTKRNEENESIERSSKNATAPPQDSHFYSSAMPNRSPRRPRQQGQGEQEGHAVISTTKSKQPQECESVAIYNDPASRGPGFSDLDPFIAYVERMWEEVEAPSCIDKSKKASGQSKKKGMDNRAHPANLDTPPNPSRMKIRARWFFKREDLEGINGRFVIEGQDVADNAKSKILSTMSCRDLVLSDQTDDNFVSTILGKAPVMRVMPANESDNAKLGLPLGAFRCNYDVKICPATESAKEGVLIFKPCRQITEQEDAPRMIDNDNEHQRDPKRSKLRNNVRPLGVLGGKENNQAKSFGDGTKLSNPFKINTPPKDDNTSSDLRAGESGCVAGSSSSLSLEPQSEPFKPVTSEGATTIGKIQIGPQHQAVVPPKPDLQRKTTLRTSAGSMSQRNPVIVWNPALCDSREVQVDDFLDEACAIISSHMRQTGLKPFHELNCLESPNMKAEAKRPRECNIDCLLTELQECKYNTLSALAKISEKPEKFMTIWSKEEKILFDDGFRSYRESLRMISKNIGFNKSCKDVIDYHYRFKLPENFRRYKAKKREQAQWMMECVEDRMLNEKLLQEAREAENNAVNESNPSNEDGNPSVVTNGAGGILPAMPSARVGNVNNRIRTWFRTGGGGEGAVGATQLRRNLAYDFLSQVQEKIGIDAYLTLAKRLKAYNSQSGTSLSDLKTTAEDIMKMHPDLLGRFMTFLPKDFRSTVNV